MAKQVNDYRPIVCEARKQSGMNEYYTARALIDKLHNAGIKINRSNLFVKIKNGILRPQVYSIIGKRKYPKYSAEYINKLIACAIIETKLDWKKAKQVTLLEGEPQKI